MKNIVVLISGSGTNLQAIIDACATGRISTARVSFVFSNRKSAYGLIRASSASPPIPSEVLALQPYLKSAPDRTRIQYDLEIARRILNKCIDDGVHLVVLAGFLHILSQEFLEVFSGIREFDEGRRVKTEIPIINLHPALPGAFDGAGAIERAFEAFRRGEIQGTGVMVHHVVRDVDRGEPILTRNVEILENDDLAALEERIHAVEHEILVEAVEKVLQQSSPI
ncbi:hypothetical protein BS47DRAFT_1389212 [Hydnum rufescens UP504]|uniref:phosphoribosylglycinamide formyltransferase 1 n=1 Tax=Hydnum rufescens UP504 TaxID=1448309 RepID=A0A9P6B614_9AGAM|nr:hypothetical protein BS47DRAFT_1389212 [Hydnum rufescens UP504]